MINKLSVCSPIPGIDQRSRLPLFRLAVLHGPKVSSSLAFGLLCLVLSISSATAQTRPKRATNPSKESVQRDDEVRSGLKESGKLDTGREAPPAPLVRKTALTYSPRTGNAGAATPELTNDIVIISRAEETSAARRLAAGRLGIASNIPSIWPVVGVLRNGVGMRNNPFGGSSVEFHKGQDISAPSGTPVNTTADGVVVRARWISGYGNGIYIDHGNGITTRYGHLSRIDVVEGQTVKRGQHLGLVGSTGRSTGPHLHYEVRINGQPTSPLQYLPPVAPATPVAPSTGVQHGAAN